MNTIKSWSPAELSRFREAVNGERSAAPRTEAVRDGLQDVLVLSPQPGASFAAGARVPEGPLSDSGKLQDQLTQAGVSVREELQDIGVTARVTAEQASELQDQGYLLVDNSPRQWLPSLPQVSGRVDAQWALPTIDGAKMVKADVLHANGVTGKGQTVAVLDSGFDYAPMNDKIAYLNITDGSTKHHDGAGHGTHVVSDILKTAPEAEVFMIQVMQDDGTGSISDIIKGMKAVEKMKDGGRDIDVVNMSLGGAPDGLPDSMSPINYMVNRLSKKGITVVAAAGNSGPKEHTIGSPADAPSALAIGSALNEKTVSDFSSRGPTDDGDIRPHVMAPGEFIPGWAVEYSDMFKTAKAVDGLREKDGAELKQFLSERPKLIEALGLPEDILSRPDEEVEQLTKPKLPPVGLNEKGEVMAPGTSFAAPITAGVLASLEQIHDSSPAENRELLMKNADSMGNYTGNEQGAGFVNAEKMQAQLQVRNSVNAPVAPRTLAQV